MRNAIVIGLIGFGCVIAATTCSAMGAGADILYTTLGGGTGFSSFGPVNVPAQGGNVYAYALGSGTCNIGDQPLAWNSAQSPRTPGLLMNAYRLSNGRLVQIGTGNAKTACCAANFAGCSMTCQTGPTGTLHAGCMDVYASGINAAQGKLAPRSSINPITGAFDPFPIFAGDLTIGRRLQIREADMNPTANPGALYFAEGQYVCLEDAQNGNWANNASYTQVSIAGGSYAMSATGAFYVARPAIYAWQDHGGGAPGVVDPNVVIHNVDVPGEGRYIVASKITQAGRNNWHYEYAIFNFNSHRAARSFRVPLPAGASVSNVGFSDVWYHDEDAIYDGTDWTAPASSFELRWSCTQTEAQNPNANALRFSTMYNFWFDCNRAPVAGHAEIDLFKAAAGCQPAKVSFPLSVPADECAADIARNGAVDTDDLLAIISSWGPCACAANCPANIDKTNNNTAVDTDDLLRIISSWGGCP